MRNLRWKDMKKRITRSFEKIVGKYVTRFFLNYFFIYAFLTVPKRKNLKFLIFNL